MNPQNNSIVASSIAEAWQGAVALLLAAPDAQRPVLSVSVCSENWERLHDSQTEHAALNSFLLAKGLKAVSTTANTIFPSSLWNRDRPRDELYQRYMRILPRLRRRPANQYGLYFERMIAYGLRGPGTEDVAINQLEKVIQFFLSGNRRRSALQLAILDPSKDLTNQPLRGFPCLQQVSLCAEGPNGWSVTGYYATQDIIARGYGNYVGLARLGDFVATAVGRRLTRVNCVAGVALLGQGISKTEARRLVADLQGAAQ